jgi:hypothetical protein
MRRAVVVLVAVAASVLGIGTVSAGASQHNEKACTDAGGVWTNDQGFKTCTFTEIEEGKNDNFQCTTTDETGGQGNIGNKTQGPFIDETEENTGSGKCPPGQYP